MLVFTSAGMSDPAKLVALLEENDVGTPEELFSLDQDDATTFIRSADVLRPPVSGRAWRPRPRRRRYRQRRASPLADRESNP